MAFKRLRIVFIILVVIYVISPIVFKYSPFVQRSLLFMNFVNTQYNFNLSQPEDAGIKCARQLRLEHQFQLQDHIYKTADGRNLNDQVPKIELGVWHILPESSLPSCASQHNRDQGDKQRATIEDKLAFSDDRPIVLYVHGNGGNRAGHHRQQLYRRLAYEHDYHIVTFDYRGYGDSTFEQPTATGLSSDARFMYEWLLRQPNVSNKRVIVWGHSLGTGVAVRMVASLPEDIRPNRLILEAPFDSLANAVANHPFSTPFRIIPYFDYFFVDPIAKSTELNFDSSSIIGKIKTTPIMILHAEDDAIIPFKLGVNLYEKAAGTLGKSKVVFVSISASHGLGHKHICRHDETMSKVKHFVSSEL